MGGNKESKASNQNHLIQRCRSKIKTRFFFHFCCLLKHSTKRKKCDICSIPHLHIHQYSYKQYQADPIFSALGHFSKSFFGISFYRQVLGERKQIIGVLQKFCASTTSPSSGLQSQNEAWTEQVGYTGPFDLKICFLQDSFWKVLSKIHIIYIICILMYAHHKNHLYDFCFYE